jgi:hypothetical protein
VSRPLQGRTYGLAGIDLLSGKVHALVRDRHRSREFIEFLKLLDAAYPVHTAIKLILDNHSAHISSAGRFICDVLRGHAPPLDPQEVTREIAQLAKEYRCLSVQGDAYSADWIVSSFRECHVTYLRSEKSRSDLYLEGLPAFSRGLVSLPEHRRLGRELRLLERHVSRAGRDRVDHGRGGSDDYSNAVFGALNMAMVGSRYRYPSGPSGMDWVSGGPTVVEAEATKQFQAARFQSHLFRGSSCGGRRY